MASTKEQIVAAAIELLGTEGARALTHRRVDERAGLPPGSTSNHFRTRAALVAGASEGVVAAEMQGARGMLPETPEALIEQTAQLIEALTGPMRVITAARHVLFLEAAHDPALRALINASRGEYVAVVVDWLVHLGASDPESGADALMAVSEGIILHRIARHDASDPRPAIAVAVRGALGVAAGP